MHGLCHRKEVNARQTETVTVSQADAGGEAKLFYMYYEAQEPLPHIVDDTPILIWLNGGPGCTSMIGNFYEIGPQRVTSNGSLVDFEFTWNKYGLG